MAIATLDQYIASNKQRIGIGKTATRVSVALMPFTILDLAGNPGAGTLPGTSTTAPVKPTDATAGFPLIDFTTGITYLSKVEFSSTVTSRLQLVDVLSKSGAYSYAAGTTTITSVLDISSRCPDYSGAGDTEYGNRNELWCEVTTAFVTGTAWQVQVTYYNQANSLKTSIITTAAAAAALTLGKMFQIPLAAGDTGVQSLKSVIVTNGGTAMTAGAFNVLIIRTLWANGRVGIAGYGDIHDMLKTGLPTVYNDSAIMLIAIPDGTSVGYPNIYFELANG